MKAHKFEFVIREKEIVKGIRVVPTPGHTPFHQSVLIESDGERAFFLADMLPTHAHLPLAWIMGYDVEPLVTLETKRAFSVSRDENWLLIFEHDATVPWGRVQHDARAIAQIARSSIPIRSFELSCAFDSWDDGRCVPCFEGGIVAGAWGVGRDRSRAHAGRLPWRWRALK